VDPVPLNSWYGETSKFSLKAPFKFTVDFTKFPMANGNSWGALIGIGSKKIIKSANNIYDDASNFLINVKEARKVCGNG
jgi:hypothetical protein